MSVSCERAGTVAILTLHVDGGDLKLHPEDLRALTDHLAELGSSTAPCHAVVLRSAAKDFCLGRGSGRSGAPTPAEIDDIIKIVGGANQALERFPGATIAAVRGRAFGAGLSLASRCDIVVAAQTAQLSFPEVAHDIPPTIVMSYFRFELSRKALSDLVLTAREVSGTEGLSLGLVSRTCSDAEVDATAMDIAQRVGGFDGSTVRAVKKFLVETEGMSRASATDYGNALMRAEFFARSVR